MLLIQEPLFSNHPNKIVMAVSMKMMSVSMKSPSNQSLTVPKVLLQLNNDTFKLKKSASPSWKPLVRSISGCLEKNSITVHTDHQPLQSIFQKDLISALKQLQKMMLFLQRYNFKVTYRKGSSLFLADTLSRAPCHDNLFTSKELETFQVFRAHLSELDPVSTALRDTTREQLQKATLACPDMQLLTQHIINGRPATKQHLPNQLQVFWHFRKELSIADGLVLKSTRVIVPSSIIVREQMYSRGKSMLKLSHLASCIPEV